MSISIAARRGNDRPLLSWSLSFRVPFRNSVDRFIKTSCWRRYQRTNELYFATEASLTYFLKRQSSIFHSTHYIATVGVCRSIWRKQYFIWWQFIGCSLCWDKVVTWRKITKPWETHSRRHEASCHSWKLIEDFCATNMVTCRKTMKKLSLCCHHHSLHTKISRRQLHIHPATERNSIKLENVISICQANGKFLFVKYSSSVIREGLALGEGKLLSTR